MTSCYNKLIITLVIAASFILTGCRAKKPDYYGNLDATQTSQTDAKMLFAEIAESYGEWQDLYVPVNFTLDAPKKLSVSGRATFVNGKEINVSFRLLGMEIAVIYVNESTIYVVDKYHKVYLREEIKDLLKGYDITITDLQNILLGRITAFGKGTITPQDVNDFTFLTGDSQWILTPSRQLKDTDWHYLATKTTPPLLSAISVRIKDKGAVECVYTEPTATPAGIVEGIMSIIAPLSGTNVEATATWSLDQAKWNEGRTIKFKEPSASYKKLDTKTLLESLDNL